MRNVRTVTFFLVGGNVVFTVGAANVSQITIQQNGDVTIFTTVGGATTAVDYNRGCPYSSAL